jgi:hypothetical protein
MRTVSLLLAVLSLALGACAAADEIERGEWMPLSPPRTAFFPADFEDEIWIDMARFEEPQLHTDGALNGFASRYRLSLSGINCEEYVIRIEESAGGQVRGWVKDRNKCKPGPEGDIGVRRFLAGRDDLRELDALFDAAKMFELYPEFWELTDPDAICIDGNQLVFERRNAAGYRISTANAQCTASLEMIEATRKFIALAGEDSAEGLLR